MANSDKLSGPLRLAQVQTIVQDATLPRFRLDFLTDQVRNLLSVPVSMINLVADDHQVVLSVGGTGLPPAIYVERRTSIDRSICQWVVDSDAPLSIEDATQDPVVCTNPAVSEEGGIRAYLGCPIHSLTGEVLGSMCAIDFRPRVWSEQDRLVLNSLTHQANAVILTAMQEQSQI